MENPERTEQQEPEASLEALQEMHARAAQDMAQAQVDLEVADIRANDAVARRGVAMTRVEATKEELSKVRRMLARRLTATNVGKFVGPDLE